MLANGKSTVRLLIADVPHPTPVLVKIMTKDGKLLASRKQEWQPQKKWTIYCVSYSHQDLGFGDYPHRLRTSIRHENIRTPLRFCRETDAWPHDDQYRFNTPPPARAWATLESVSGAGSASPRTCRNRPVATWTASSAFANSLLLMSMARIGR